MAETDYSKFRLGALTLEAADALAASAGSRTQAVREALAYWRLVVEQAGRLNAAELSAEEWARLAHVDPSDPLPSDLRDEAERSSARDWSAWLAAELAGTWEGRALVLPEHKAAKAAAHRLAKRVSGWGVVRGYALYACLRYFWTHPDAGEGGGDWWHPETWMAPETSTE